MLNVESTNMNYPKARAWLMTKLLMTAVTRGCLQKVQLSGTLKGAQVVAPAEKAKYKKRCLGNNLEIAFFSRVLEEKKKKVKKSDGSVERDAHVKALRRRPELWHLALLWLSRKRAARTRW